MLLLLLLPWRWLAASQSSHISGLAAIYLRALAGHMLTPLPGPLDAPL